MSVDGPVTGLPWHILDIDLWDIYRDFLKDDEEDLASGPVKVTECAEEEECFEWVSKENGWP